MGRRSQATVVIHKVVRCAVYRRKSTDEGLDKDFNTLDAQREMAESYIASQRHDGWTTLPDRYDDGGYTGANTNRPALQRLLADVESGKVNCVVVYRYDRVSRNLLVRPRRSMHGAPRRPCGAPATCKGRGPTGTSKPW